MAATLFRFNIDYEAADREGTELFCATMWAPNAKDALAAFMRRDGATKGFVGVVAIDPVPTHVRLEEDDALDALSEFDRLNALLVLAEQSGCSTPAEARFYVKSLRDVSDAKALGKLILAEWEAEHTGAELMAALATSGAPRMAAE